MKSSSKIALGVLSVILIAVFVWFFKDIIIYMVVSAVLSLIGRPILKMLWRIRIKNWHVPDAMAALITLVVMYGVLFMVFALFIPVIAGQVRNLESVDANAIAIGLQEPIAQVEELMQRYDLLDADTSVEEYVQQRVFSLAQGLQVSNILNNVVGFTGDFFIGIFSISFITFFFLKEKELLKNLVNVLTPSGYEEKIRHIGDNVKGLLSRYVLGVLGEVILVGLLIAGGLALLGVENALGIGLMAGIFNVIPYLGPILGALMGISLAILGNLELEFYGEMIPLIGKISLVFIVVQLIDNFIFQPLIYSSSVKAHPLEVFIVILMAGTVAGVGGMILAIPSYTILRAIAQEFFSQFKIVKSITHQT